MHTCPMVSPDNHGLPGMSTVYPAMSYVIHVQCVPGKLWSSWDVRCIACTRQCPMSYMSSSIQTLYFLWHPGINSVIIIHAENVIPNGDPMNKPYVIHDHSIIVPNPTTSLRYLATVSICIDLVYISAHINFMHQQNRPVIMVLESISMN